MNPPTGGDERHNSELDPETVPTANHSDETDELTEPDETVKPHRPITVPVDELPPDDPDHEDAPPPETDPATSPP